MPAFSKKQRDSYKRYKANIMSDPDELDRLDIECQDALIEEFDHGNPDRFKRSNKIHRLITQHIVNRYAKQNGMEYDENTKEYLENAADALLKSKTWKNVLVNSELNLADFVSSDTEEPSPKMQTCFRWIEDIFGFNEKKPEQVYEQVKDQIAPEDREAFIRLSKVNENVRMYRYDLAKSPEELAEFFNTHTTSDDLEYFNALKEYKANIDRVKEIEYSGTLPTAFARMYFYFLDHTDSKEARKNNAEVIAKLADMNPANDDFRKEFAAQMITRMLAVPDTALAPNSLEEARVNLETYPDLSAIWNVESFLKELKYEVPKEYADILMHKNDLWTKNVSGFDQLAKGAVYFREADLLTKEMPALDGYEVASNYLKPGEEKSIPMEKPLCDAALAAAIGAASGVTFKTIPADPKKDAFVKEHPFSVDMLNKLKVVSQKVQEPNAPMAEGQENAENPDAPQDHEKPVDPDAHKAPDQKNEAHPDEPGHEEPGIEANPNAAADEAAPYAIEGDLDAAIPINKPKLLEKATIENIRDRLEEAKGGTFQGSKEYTALLTAFRAFDDYYGAEAADRPKLTGDEENALVTDLQTASAEYYNAKSELQHTELRGTRMDIAKELFILTAEVTDGYAHEAQPHADVPVLPPAVKDPQQIIQSLHQKYDSNKSTITDSIKQYRTNVKEYRKQSFIDDDFTTPEFKHVEKCVLSNKPIDNNMLKGDIDFETVHLKAAVVNHQKNRIDYCMKGLRNLKGFLSLAAKSIEGKADEISRGDHRDLSDAEAVLNNFITKHDPKEDFFELTFDEDLNYCIKKMKGSIDSLSSIPFRCNKNVLYTLIHSQDRVESFMAEQFIGEQNGDTLAVSIRKFFKSGVLDQLAEDFKKPLTDYNKAADSYQQSLNTFQENLTFSKSEFKDSIYLLPEYQKQIASLREDFCEYNISDSENGKKLLSALDKLSEQALGKTRGYKTLISPEALKSVRDTAKDLQDSCDHKLPSLQKLSVLGTPREEHILEIQKEPITAFVNTLDGLHERLENAKAFFSSSNSVEYLKMLTKLEEVKTAVQENPHLLSAGPDEVNYNDPAFLKKLQELRNTAAEYYDAKFAQDKNSTRYERFKIAEEIMGLKGIENNAPAVSADKTYKVGEVTYTSIVTAINGTKNEIMNALNSPLNDPASTNQLLQYSQVIKDCVNPDIFGDNSPLTKEEQELFKGAAIVCELIEKEQAGWDAMKKQQDHTPDELALAKRDVVLGRGVRNLFASAPEKSKLYMAFGQNKKNIEGLKTTLLKGSSASKAVKEIRAEGARLGREGAHKQAFAAGKKLQAPKAPERGGLMQ